MTAPMTEPPTDSPITFPFDFDPRYRALARLVGVRPETALVTLADDVLTARFGPWSVATPLDNIAGVQITGPYSFVKTAGPAHLSFHDRGLTMATNGRRGVCLRFHDPVSGIEPTGRLRHPGLTVTVADCDGLRAAVTR